MPGTEQHQWPLHKWSQNLLATLEFFEVTQKECKRESGSDYCKKQVYALKRNVRTGKWV